MASLGAYELGDSNVSYHVDDALQVSLEIRPAASEVVDHRRHIGNDPWIAALPNAGEPPARTTDPIVHVVLRGDAATSGWGQGRTMRWSPSNDRFSLRSHVCAVSEGRTRIVTTLHSVDGVLLEYLDGTRHMEVTTTLVNESDQPVTVDALSSFSLSGLSPFDPADSPERLRIHRLRSAWSAEARQVSETLEQLHLERSWSGVARLSERFGQVGTMPARGWMPFLAVEDVVAGVSWAAAIAWPGSWQMEVARLGDDLSISGGLADREFGHWSHTVKPGGRFCGPTAIVACAAGPVDDVADRLLEYQGQGDPSLPGEESLPIVFNEWCTSWGNPDRSRVMAVADRLADQGIGYLVIDAGWYRSDEGGEWWTEHGDWKPNSQLFPSGMKEVTDHIRNRGMVPGLWFEYETVGSSSAAWHEVEHLLRRDGVTLDVGSRRFWDLENPAVVELLIRCVADRLRDDGFGYLKIDYNEHLGLGVDNPAGLGEGLRRQVVASQRLLREIRDRVPGLVIENCASGGHRIEPWMAQHTAMTSFSDAHEVPEIPIIAGNLLRVLHARRMQIWCVLRETDSDQRMLYSLTATLIGRMCLSGDVLELSAHQWTVLRDAIAFQRLVAPIIRSGVSRRLRFGNESYRHPTGWQAVTRHDLSGSRLLVIVHTFRASPTFVDVPLDGNWYIESNLSDSPINVEAQAGFLRVSDLRDFDGVAVELRRTMTE